VTSAPAFGGEASAGKEDITQLCRFSKHSLFLASVFMVSLVATGVAQTGAPKSGEQSTTRPSSSNAGQPAEVTIVGCLTSDYGKLRLNPSESGKIYNLIGLSEELRRQVGDKVEVSGTEEGSETPPGQRFPESTLRVRSVKNIFHQNPAGVRPSLGDVAHWRSYTDKAYGVVLHYPETLELLNEPFSGPAFVGGADFVGQEGVVTLQSFAVPARMYPKANFGGGNFVVNVDPTIRSEGTCRQFGWAERRTSPLTARGIEYPGVSRTGVAMGTASDQYHFHAYQNGFCYEFDFSFAWNDGTGMDPGFQCSVQPVLEQNQRELMTALLSQVKFVTPAIRNSARRERGRRTTPTVLSFERSAPDTTYRSTAVTVSWSTRGADYVQLHYPCVEKLSVSELGGIPNSAWPPGADMKCGALVDQNFPPDGSAKLMLANFNPSSVSLVLSIVPFTDGVGYPKESKTIIISVGPHP